MCYPATVNQRSKELGYSYGARVQLDLYEELFKHRMAGSGAKITRAMEADFLADPKSPQAMRIASLTVLIMRAATF